MIKPPFTHKQLCDAEWELGRAVGTISQYADAATMAKLKVAAYVLAEVRNAGAYLSSPQTDAATRLEVANRLLELFAEA